MKKSKIFNYVNVVLMAFLLILHFMPFWSFDGGGTSIQSYIWFPSDNGHVTTYLTGQLGDSYSINNILLMPIFVIVATVAGIILCVWKSNVAFMSLVPLFCGIIGAGCYLAQPAFQLGSNWILHLLVCIAMIVVSVLTLLSFKKQEKE